ncbi:MAG: PepSY-associated TM helix domain-containing protein [Pseudomonadota bacterium]
MSISSELFKRGLAAHSWLGIMVSALMYVICLTGTLLVYHAELEQWEQADAPVVEGLDLTSAEASFNAFLEAGVGVTPHMYLVLPTDESPHARIATETQSWFLERDGQLGIVEDNSWSTMLLDLHLYLHLPKSWGMLLVSALGAVLVGLVVSGFLAHPSIFKGAFKLRQRTTDQLPQTDLHNRLSVWAAPFHLTIAITGAYFGLALPILAVVAEAEFGGNRGAVVEAVFGAEPDLEAASSQVQIVTTLQKLKAIAPDAEPFNVIVHDANSTNPFLEVFARLPQRLMWGEGYRFTTDGDYLGNAGWSDGTLGQQVLYSIYRLHFGTFDGQRSKLLYLILGLALTIVSATGTNIWLAKRRKEDELADLWTGIVWGTPIALALSALVRQFTSSGLGLVFWLSLAGACFLALAIRQTARARWLLKSALALVLLATLLAHTFQFGALVLSTSASLINGALVVTILALGAQALAFPKHTSAQPAANLR